MIIPKKMREDLGYAVKDVSDVNHKELTPGEVLEIFEKRYKKYTPVFKITEVHFRQIDGIQTTVTIEKDGEKINVESKGNGRLDAVSNALSEYFNHAIAYVGIVSDDGKEYYGAGVDHDIIRASIDALESAMNRSLEKAE